MPLGIKKVRNPVWEKKHTDSKKAAARLIQFEKELLSDNIDNKREKNERIVKRNANLDPNIEPCKKQKRNNLTSDKHGCKSVITEKKEKLETKSLSKKTKTPKKVKLNRTNDMQTSNKNIDCEMKATTSKQLSGHISEGTLPESTSQSNTSIKKTAKKPAIKKISRNSISSTDKVVTLKNVSINFNDMVHN